MCSGRAKADTAASRGAAVQRSDWLSGSAYSMAIGPLPGHVVPPRGPLTQQPIGREVQ